MSLTASLWTSVSGLLAHGERMNVVGNNISNVNTLGFKGARMDFQDFVYQYVGTASGVGQVGRGTSIGAVMNDFSQAAFETSTDNTDIGIEGNGFFQVKPKNNNTAYYTRAGNFRFDADGFLTDPHGYVLQGWKIDNTASSLLNSSGVTSSTSSSIKGTGVPVDIQLETFSCPPKHTNNMRLSVNLDSSAGNDRTVNEDNPFFAMLEAWDATPTAVGDIVPLGEDAYAYASTIEVFDEGGQSHKLTVYFDRVEQNLDTNIQGMKNNEIMWEYVVTMDPTEDMRNFTNPPTPGGEVPDEYKGLLMSGTLNFNSSGQIRDMTAYVPVAADMGNMGNWVEAPLSNNGFPVLAPNFSGRDGASSAWDPSQSRVNPNADGFLIEMDLGLRSKTSTWSGNAPSTIAGWVNMPAGQYKTEKVPLTVAPGTVYPNMPDGTAGGTVNGVVGAGGVLYEQATGAAGAGQVSDGTYLWEQKVATDGVGVNEVLHTDGYVYEQAYNDGTAGGTYPPPAPAGYIYQDNNGTGTIMIKAADGIYYDTTGAIVAAPVDPIVQVRDAGAPVASNRGVATANPVLKYQADGVTPIPLTETQPYSGLGNYGEVQESASTSFSNNTGSNFFERLRSQDGYTYGELRYVSVSGDGVLSGAYSNGVTLELYQVVLYDFPSKQNMRREGGNLFTETRESGMPTSGAAGSGSFGTTKGNSIEQSNVDLAREFVNMITTQRGFQANSKTVTTVDTMLETVINMKR